MWPLFPPALLLYFATASAVPLLERATTAITATDLTEFQLFSQYSTAAYCFNNIGNGTGQFITCSANGGVCPIVEAAEATILQAFSEVGDTQTSGYIAVDPTNKLIVVAFQGTSVDVNPTSVLTDLNIDRDATKLCGTANTNDGCEIHSGFLAAANDIESIVITTVGKAIAANPGFKIVTTGHSLGGAVAALTGVKLRNMNHRVDIYTYGQPRLGTDDISLFIQSQSPSRGKNFRITHFDDVVPKLPPGDIGGKDWNHYFPEFFIDKDEGDVTLGDMEQVNAKLTSAQGNEGTDSRLGILGNLAKGVDAHRLYFGYISACDSKSA